MLVSVPILLVLLSFLPSTLIFSFSFNSLSIRPLNLQSLRHPHPSHHVYRPLGLLALSRAWLVPFRSWGPQRACWALTISVQTASARASPLHPHRPTLLLPGATRERASIASGRCQKNSIQRLCPNSSSRAGCSSARGSTRPFLKYATRVRSYLRVCNADRRTRRTPRHSF